MVFPLFAAAVISALSFLGAEMGRKRGQQKVKLARRAETRAERGERKAKSAVRELGDVVKEVIREVKKKKKRRRPGRKAKRPPKPARRKSIPEHKVKLRTGAKPSKPKPKKKRRTKRRRGMSAKQGAQRMFDYATMKIRAGKSHHLGSKGNVNEGLKRMQKAMGTKPDGIYGPLDRKRGKQLIGRTFPRRRKVKVSERTSAPAPPPPVRRPAPEPEPEEPEGRTPEEAATELYEYVEALGPVGKGRRIALGYKDNTNDFIEDAQLDMGMSEDDADGIYGRDTRTLGKSLIGKTFAIRNP